MQANNLCARQGAPIGAISGQQAQPAVARESEVNAAMNQLAIQVSTMRDCMERLDSRLQPVMRTEPAAGTKGAAISRAYNSLLAVMIAERSEQLSHLTQRAEAILDLLEV
jgi:hypothetical protein